MKERMEVKNEVRLKEWLILWPLLPVFISSRAVMILFDAPRIPEIPWSLWSRFSLVSLLFWKKEFLNKEGVELLVRGRVKNREQEERDSYIFDSILFLFFFFFFILSSRFWWLESERIEGIPRSTGSFWIFGLVSVWWLLLWWWWWLSHLSQTAPWRSDSYPAASGLHLVALYDSLYTSETVRSESMLPYENECMINLLKHTVVLFFGVRLYFRKRKSDCAYD